VYSLGVGFKLTDKQISTLDERTDEFLTAGYTGRDQIVQNAFDSFANAWPKCVTFNKDLVRAVGVPLAILGRSNAFLAYSPVALSQNKTADGRAHSQNPNSDRRRKVWMPFTHERGH